MVFHRLEVISKAKNVARINRKCIRGDVKTPKISSTFVVICGPLPRWRFRGWRGERVEECKSIRCL